MLWNTRYCVESKLTQFGRWNVLMDGHTYVHMFIHTFIRNVRRYITHTYLNKQIYTHTHTLLANYGCIPWYQVRRIHTDFSLSIKKRVMSVNIFLNCVVQEFIIVECLMSGSYRQVSAGVVSYQVMFEWEQQDVTDLDKLWTPKIITFLTIMLRSVSLCPGRCGFSDRYSCLAPWHSEVDTLYRCAAILCDVL